MKTDLFLDLRMKTDLFLSQHFFEPIPPHSACSQTPLSSWHVISVNPSRHFGSLSMTCCKASSMLSAFTISSGSGSYFLYWSLQTFFNFVIGDSDLVSLKVGLCFGSTTSSFGCPGQLVQVLDFCPLMHLLQPLYFFLSHLMSFNCTVFVALNSILFLLQRTG